LGTSFLNIEQAAIFILENEKVIEKSYPAFALDAEFTELKYKKINYK